MKNRSSALYAISQAWSSRSGVHTVFKTVPEMRSHIKKFLGYSVPKFSGKPLDVLRATLNWVDKGCPAYPPKIDGRSRHRKICPIELASTIESDKSLCAQGFVSDRGRQARVARRLGVSPQVVSFAIKKLIIVDFSYSAERAAERAAELGVKD